MNTPLLLRTSRALIWGYESDGILADLLPPPPPPPQKNYYNDDDDEGEEEGGI